jgi:UrcA family protein
MRTLPILSTITLAATLATGIVGVAAPASATASLRQIAVHYSYEDLATATGRADLDQRIRRAAKSVCTSPMGDRLGDAACAKVVEEKAQRELDLRHATGTVLAAR